MSTRALRKKKDSDAPVELHVGNGNGKSASIDDITELFENETTVVTVYDTRDRFGKVKRDTGLRFEIGPFWSPEAQEIAQERRDRIRKLPDGKVDTDDPEFEASVFEQMIRVTKRWWKEPDSPDGIRLNGELLPCTEENVRMIYAHPRLRGVYEQVRSAYLDTERFFGKPSKTA